MLSSVSIPSIARSPSHSTSVCDSDSAAAVVPVTAPSFTVTVTLAKPFGCPWYTSGNVVEPTGTTSDIGQLLHEGLGQSRLSVEDRLGSMTLDQVGHDARGALPDTPCLDDAPELIGPALDQSGRVGDLEHGQNIRPQVRDQLRFRDLFGAAEALGAGHPLAQNFRPGHGSASLES